MSVSGIDFACALLDDPATTEDGGGGSMKDALLAVRALLKGTVKPGQAPDDAFDNEGSFIDSVNNLRRISKEAQNEVSLCVESHVQSLIQGIQEEATDILRMLKVTADERDSVLNDLGNEKKLTFELFSNTMSVIDQLRSRAKVCRPCLRGIWKHEQLLLDAIRFEEASIISASQAGLEASDNVRARSEMGIALASSISRIQKELETMKDSNGQELKLYGTSYIEKLEAQAKALPSVPTDFSALHRNMLVFFDEASGELESGVGSYIPRIGQSDLQNMYGFMNVKAGEGMNNDALKDWQEVMAVMSGRKLSMFHIDPDLVAKGTIPLQSAKVSAMEGSVPGGLYPSKDCFQVRAPLANRTFFVNADSSENRDAWIRLIKNHMDLHVDDDTGSNQIVEGQGQDEDPASSEDFTLKSQLRYASHVGFMTKSGGRFNLSWKKRLMVLSKKHISYYKCPVGLHMIGSIVPSSCTAASSETVAPADCERDLIYVIETDQGRLLCSFETSNERDRWLGVLDVEER